MKSIVELLTELKTDEIMPALIYNEGWMLRICLDWFSKHYRYREITKDEDNVMNVFANYFSNSNWYSEIELYTPFKKLAKKSGHGEGNTHADAVIGDIIIDNKQTKSGLELKENCKTFIVCEAKMFSPFSKNTKNCPNYDQFTRNIACIAYEALKHKNTLEKIGFYVFFPKVKNNYFQNYKKNWPQNTFKSIKKRIKQHKDDIKSLLNDEKEIQNMNDFVNGLKEMIDRINVEFITWEQVCDFIDLKDKKNWELIKNFYDKCLSK